MPNPTVEILIKARDQFSDATRKANLDFAAMKIAATDSEKEISKLTKTYGLSRDMAQDVNRALEEQKGKFDNSRIAAMGLSQELGLGMPRALSAFLAKSETIGPILSTAFSTVAVLGMIEVLSRIPALFDKLKSALTGWDEERKRAYDDFIKANIEAGNHAEQLNEKLNLGAAGRTEGAVAKASAEYEAINKNIGLATERSKELLQTQQRQQFVLDDLNTLTHNIGQYIPFLRLYWAEADEQAEQYKKTLPQIIQFSDEYAKKLQEQTKELKAQAEHQLQLAQNAQLLVTRGISDQATARRRQLFSAGMGLDAETEYLRSQLALVGGEGVEQDPWRAVQRRALEAENRRNSDRLAELQAQRATASLNIDPERRATDLRRINGELEAEAFQHENNNQEISNKGMQDELAAREKFYQLIREMQQSNADFEDKWTEREAQQDYQLAMSKIRNAEMVQQAKLRGLPNRSIQGEYSIAVSSIDQEITATQKLMKAYDDLGKHQEAVGLQPELERLQAQRQVAAIDANNELFKKFREGAGKAWDDFRQKGFGAFADLASYIGKQFFEGLATRLLFGGGGTSPALSGIIGAGAIGGSSGGGILGNLGGGGLFGKLFGAANSGPWSEKIPGLGNGGLFSGGGGLLGGLFGSGGATGLQGLGGILGIQSFSGTGLGFTGGGLAGSLGLGGAGLFGLGALTIPIVGGIVAGAIFGLSKLFGHHQQAPFTRDPNDYRSREFLFFSGAQSLKDAADTINKVFGQMGPINTMSPQVLVAQGMPLAIQSSTTFTRSAANGLAGGDS